MSNLNKPPQYLIDAVKQGKRIDPKDPWVRKMLKEERKKEKQKKIIEAKEQEERWKEQEERWIERNVEQLEREHREFQKQEEFNNNTVDWNYPKKCKWCDCESVRIILRPDIMHYAEYYCNVCHRYNDWLPYSKQYDEQERTRRTQI